MGAGCRTRRPGTASRQDLPAETGDDAGITYRENKTLMSTITPHYRSVQQLLQSQSFAIDEYQREYKWEKENIDELLADLQGKFFSAYKPGAP